MTDAIGKFEAWFKDNGGYIHPSVELCMTPNAGFSLCHKKDSPAPPADVAVIGCPHSLSLSSVNAYSVSPIFQNLDFRLPQEILEKATPRFLAALCLCVEWLRGEKSFWNDYINVLPGLPARSQPDARALRRGIGEVDTPLWWSDVECSWLENTNVERGIEELRESWAIAWKEWEVVVMKWANENGFEKLDWYLFKWAMTIFGSRSFSSSTLRNIEIEGKPLLGKHNPHSLLYPGIDLLNHSSTTSNRWASDESSLSIICHDKVEAAELIWNTYGSQSNSQLILSWGFAIADNSEDTFALRLLSTKDSELLDIIQAAMPKTEHQVDMAIREGSSKGPAKLPTTKSEHSKVETNRDHTNVENADSKISQQMAWPPPTADQAASTPADISNNMFLVRLPTTQDEDSDMDEYPSPADAQSYGFQGIPEALLNRLAAQVVNVRERQLIIKEPGAFSPTKLYKHLGPRNQLAVADLLKQKLLITLTSMTSPAQWVGDGGSQRSASRKEQALIYHQGQVRILRENLTNLQHLFSSAGQTPGMALPELSTLNEMFAFIRNQSLNWADFAAGFSGISDIPAIVDFIEKQDADDLFMMLAMGGIAIATGPEDDPRTGVPLRRVIDFYTTQVDAMIFPWDPSEDVQNMRTYVGDMRNRFPGSPLWGSPKWDDTRFLRGCALLVMEESLELEHGGKRVLAVCTMGLG